MPTETDDLPQLPFAFDDVPDPVRELCLACVQYVQRATGVVLDRTPDTLPVLDHYLTTVRTATPALKGLIARAAGAYFGEVVRREHPARWHCPADEPDAWRVELERCFLYFSPVAFAIEAIERADAVEGGAGFGVSAEDVDVLREALEVFGEMPDQDFYRLTTRIEVLGPVVDRLVARALSRDEPEIDFTHEIYQHALDEEGPRS